MREGGVSPTQFSTTSTASGEVENPFTGSDDDTLEQNGDRLARVHQSKSNGDTEDIAMETIGNGGKNENAVAMTAGKWERFGEAPSNSSWETFDSSAKGGGGANGTSEATGGSAVGATAQSPGTKPVAQSEDGTEGAVCAADALISSGWTAMGGEGAGLQGEGAGLQVEVLADEPNLPYRLTRSMRATTNRKVQIVDALKQQRRLSNTSLERDPASRGGGPFANEDELSRRYNVEREWQVFVKMNRKIPGTR